MRILLEGRLHNGLYAFDFSSCLNSFHTVDVFQCKNASCSEISLSFVKSNCIDNSSCNKNSYPIAVNICET